MPKRIEKSISLSTMILLISDGISQIKRQPIDAKTNVKKVTVTVLNRFKPYRVKIL